MRKDTRLTLWSSVAVVLFCCVTLWLFRKNEGRDERQAPSAAQTGASAAAPPVVLEDASTAKAPASASEEPAAEALLLEPAQDSTAALEAPFPPPGLMIRGVVIGPDGEYMPHSDILVQDRNWDSVDDGSDAQGAFEVGPLDAGEYVLEASPTNPDLAYVADSLPLPVQAGEQDVVLQLRPAGVVHGRVLDPDAGVSVLARVRLFGEPITGLRVETSEFRLGQLPEGDYHLVAWEANGERVALLSDIEVVAGRAIEVELVLEPAASVTFRLADGVKADVLVHAWSGDRRLGDEWVTHSQPLEMRVPSGELRYQVEFTYPVKFVHEEQRVAVTPGEPQRFEIEPLAQDR